MTRGFILAGALAFALLAGALLYRWSGRAPVSEPYRPPLGVTVTFFPARDGRIHQPLVIGAATDVSFMRPFVTAYQQRRPDVAIAYIDSISTALLVRARQACKANARTADLYLSSSTDHLVLLANEGCAMALPRDVAAAAPSEAQWRGEVAAFTVEPAVFVYSARLFDARRMPHSHSALIQWLRVPDGKQGRIGIYDIETSGTGYNFAVDDAHQSSIYGRLLESFGRIGTRTYCCSNVMVDAVERGEILFAYNVQMSYAYAAKRAGSRIGVILPSDYQAIQTRSLMIPRGARDPQAATDFARFLNSPPGRQLARQQLMEPGVSNARAAATADQLLDRAVVSPLLLAMQDQSRRQRTIREWRQAIHSPAGGSPARR